MTNLSWQCAKCKRNLDGNPRMCPQCGYTIYRPIEPTTSVADRRQRAREAYYDYPRQPGGHVGHPLGAAIEVATQVKITDDIVRSAYGLIDPREMARVMFAAAGFEVVE